jgi:HlyD family secretion protein
MKPATPSKKMSEGNSRKIALAVSIGLLVFLLPRIFAVRKSFSSARPVAGYSALAEQRSFSKELRLSGTTQAAHSFVVLAPQLEGAQLSNMIITALVPAGVTVKPGDLLVVFDPQSQMKDYFEKQNKYAELAGQVMQKRAEEEIAKAKDETALRQAESDFKKAQLEIQKNEIASRIDAEKNQETLDETRATFKQLNETYELKRKAAAAAIHILELQRDRAQEAMRDAQSNSAKMTIRSPMQGVTVRNSLWLGGRMGTVQTGDQVNPGTPFMQVVDPSKMEVRVSVNQSDLAKVHIGDFARVRPDAYPGMSLPAVLDEISPLGLEGNFSDKIRVFSARFSIQGSDPRLLPDLSVALDMDLEGTKGTQRASDSVATAATR